MNIIAVDWSKDTGKRSAYISQPVSCTISRLPFDGSLEHLISHASSLSGPALIGIDAAIGLPYASWRRLHHGYPGPTRTFVDFLLGPSLPGGFFDPVARPEEWLPQRPFIRPPRGRWSLQAFIDASDGGLYRQIDRRLNANPIFVTSGLPGSVGSGTRALWRELMMLKDSSAVRVWPFHGPLARLLRGNRPVIAEIYPKACYGISLAESLPTPLRSIAKTKETARRQAVAELRGSGWLTSHRVTITDVDDAIANEDDFDALFSAAALTRVLLEKARFESPETTDRVAEGGVLGAASLMAKTRADTRTSSRKSSAARSPSEAVIGQSK